MTRYTLGLDLGSNSVGWAMIAADGDTFGDGRRIRAGVRVFPAGLAMEKNKVGTPRGQERRLARSQRRTVRRREQRIRKLRRILQEAGLLPTDRQAFAELMKQNPYLLRAVGADQTLERHEFGRAILHLGHRRGFKSNKRITKAKENKDEEKESAEAKKDRKAEDAGKSLEEQLHEQGITLGQYLSQFAVNDASREERKEAHKDPEGTKQWIRNRDRNLHYNRRTLRSMYEEEFERLWSKQAEFHPELSTEDLKADVHEAIFRQGDLWWPLDSIGRCELTGDLRCPKGHWEAQQFRLLQEINNLRLYSRETGQEEPLTREQKARLADELAPKSKLTFKAMQTFLGIERHQSFRGFEEGARREGLAGNAVEVAFAESTLAEWYAGLPADRRIELHDLLVAVKIDEEKNRAYGIDEAALRAKADEWGLSAEQADELVDIQQGLPDGHFQFSLKAIRQLLPHLQEGIRVDEAIPAAGLKREAKPAGLNRLPPVKQFDPYLTNPLVCRALTETRKIINLLIEEHGKPAEIVVELAREMRQSRKHRREILKRQKGEEELNKEAEAEVAKAGAVLRKGEARRRYKLWKEYRARCGDPAACPYCGKQICGTAWLSPAFEMDHIMPRSLRPGDNGFNNLILCCAQCNRAKGNRTPYQWLGHDEQRYEEMLRRIDKLPARKRDRFHLQTPEELEDAIHRLIDTTDPLLKATQHTSRAAVAYLQCLYQPEEQRRRVRCVKGFTTYELRGFWGVNARSLGLGPADRKNRYDHRHHAIDAVVIALTTRKHVHNLCTAYANTERRQRPHMPPPEPWPDCETFRREVQEVMDEIGEGGKLAVSHRPTRMAERRRRKPNKGHPRAQVVTRGSLHEDHGLGPVWIDKKARQRKEGVYVRRKSITELTPAVLNGTKGEVRNPEIRDLLRAECIRRGLAHRVAPDAEKGWVLERKYFRLIRCALEYWKTRDDASAKSWEPDDGRYWVDVDKRKLQNTLSKPFPILPCKKSKGGAIPIKRVRVLLSSTKARQLRCAGGKPAKFAIPGDARGNHHLEVYVKPDGSWTGRVITRIDACRRLARGKPVVCPRHEDGSELLMSLAINDMVWLVDPDDNQNKHLYRVQKISDGPDVKFRLHTDARTKEKESERRLSSWNMTRKGFRKHQATKVSVDPLGRVGTRHDQANH